MNKVHQLLVSVAGMALLVTTPLVNADYAQEQAQNQKMMQHQVDVFKRMRDPRYQRRVEEKALNGATNIATGFLEVPKNMINEVNDDSTPSVFLGMVGGAIKGSLDMAGRMMVGTMDLVTAPLITEDVIYPKRVWDDFDKSNTYGKIFRLKEEESLPATQPVAVAVKPRLPVVEDADQYTPEQVNKRIDRMFEESMRK